jgi:hypothetical protein
MAGVGVTQGLYLHIVHAHMPDEIEKWANLRKRQSQDLEHCHKIRKCWGCDATNRRPGQRMYGDADDAQASARVDSADA